MPELTKRLKSLYLQYKTPYATRGKLLFIPLAVFLVILSFATLSRVDISNKDIGSIEVVANSDYSAAGKGGPVINSSSVAFLAGTRNGLGDISNGYGNYGSYGEGPVEPSLASVSGTSLFKQSSPLTTETALNTNRGIATYVVKPRDVPSVIAASFGITTNTLLWANNLTDGQFIQPGDELTIPPGTGVLYKVRKGDTVSSIALRFRGDVGKIVAANNLPSSGAISIGDYVFVPDGEIPAVSYARSYAPQYATYLKDLGGYFIHPTAGVGYRSQGLHANNAVDIAAPCWTPIYAAAAGLVSISDAVGWNGGYGKYVKIEHSNGTQTIYAHNIQNQVYAGQRVDQGQLIAYMGSTGISTGCHVHLEVYGALNPLR